MSDNTYAIRTRPALRWSVADGRPVARWLATSAPLSVLALVAEPATAAGATAQHEPPAAAHAGRGSAA